MSIKPTPWDVSVGFRVGSARNFDGFHLEPAEAAKVEGSGTEDVYTSEVLGISRHSDKALQTQMLKYATLWWTNIAMENGHL